MSRVLRSLFSFSLVVVFVLLVAWSALSQEVSSSRTLSCSLKLKDSLGSIIQEQAWSSPLVNDSVYYYADINETLEWQSVRLRLFSRYGLNYRYAFLSVANAEDVNNFFSQFDGYVEVGNSYRLAGSLRSLGIDEPLFFQARCRFQGQ